MSSSVALAPAAAVVAVDVGKTTAAVLVTDPPKLIGELTAWAAHRHRRVATRAATKNQLLGQLDRCFPGLTLAVPDVLRTKVGRLVAEHFADPRRLAGLGASRFIRFAAVRGLQVRRPVADRLVAAAHDALPSADAAVARQVLAADLALLASLDEQVQAAETRMAELVPASPFAPLLSVPGWGVVRAGNYGAASVTRPAGPATGSSTGPQVYRRPSTSPPAGAATGRSAGKAACSCAGR